MACLWWGKIGDFRDLLSRDRICAAIDSSEPPPYWVNAEGERRTMMLNAFGRISMAIGNEIDNSYIFLEQELERGRSRADALVVAPKLGGYSGWCLTLFEAKYHLQNRSRVNELCAQIRRYRSALLAVPNVTAVRGAYKTDADYLLRTVVIIDGQLGNGVVGQLDQLDAKIYGPARTRFVKEMWRTYVDSSRVLALDGASFSQRLSSGR